MSHVQIKAAGLIVCAGAAPASAAPFSVLSWDMGAVEPGAPGFFGENIRPSNGRFFRSSLTAASDRGPVQSATSPNRIFDSYAGFDGGASASCGPIPECPDPFSGPTVPESSEDAGTGYSTNTGFGSIVPIGFTRSHFNEHGDAFGGGAFESMPRAAYNALAFHYGLDLNIFNFFVGRLTVSRGATLTGGTVRMLIASEGTPADGGVVVSMTLGGAAAFVGASNNSGDAVTLGQGYSFISLLTDQPNGLGNQQAPATGPFGDGDTYDLYILGGVPAPAAGLALALGTLCASGKRRRR